MVLLGSLYMGDYMKNNNKFLAILSIIFGTIGFVLGIYNILNS